MRTGILFLLLSLGITGCSSEGWAARWHIVRAENALQKAAHLKEKKVTFDERRPYYRKACELFVKAYEVDTNVFNLMRILGAQDACAKAEMREEEEYFLYIEEEYSKMHPQEERYGDAGVGMMEVG